MFLGNWSGSQKWAAMTVYAFIYVTLIQRFIRRNRAHNRSWQAIRDLRARRLWPPRPDDDTSFVLLLRPFRSARGLRVEHRTGAGLAGLLAGLMPGISRREVTASDDLEMFIDDQVPSGWQTVSLSLIGAGFGRLDSGGLPWRSMFGVLAVRARAIVVIPSARPACLWEIEQLQAMRLMGKALCVMPPGGGFAEELWREGAEAWRRLGIMLPTYDPVGGVFWLTPGQPVARHRLPLDSIGSALLNTPVIEARIPRVVLIEPFFDPGPVEDHLEPGSPSALAWVGGAEHVLDFIEQLCTLIPVDCERLDLDALFTDDGSPDEAAVARIASADLLVVSPSNHPLFPRLAAVIAETPTRCAVAWLMLPRLPGALHDPASEWRAGRDHTGERSWQAGGGALFAFEGRAERVLGGVGPHRRRPPRTGRGRAEPGGPRRLPRRLRVHPSAASMVRRPDAAGRLAASWSVIGAARRGGRSRRAAPRRRARRS